MPPWPEVIGAGREADGCPLARMAEARDVFGLHRLPEMSPWPEVMGEGGEADGCPLARMADDRDVSGLKSWRGSAVMAVKWPEMAEPEGGDFLPGYTSFESNAISGHVY
ncbi:hypothetical protein TH468_20910 [Thalassospira sp. MCCC 1A03138]|nr:hypothetical protein TH468_20910 [Thalassospira sp. MCCC 1A03138]